MVLPASNIDNVDIFSSQDKGEDTDIFAGKGSGVDIFSGIGSEEQYVTSEPDSFRSRVGRSFNESQKNIAESIALYAKQLGFEDLEKWAVKTAVDQDTDILEYGTPRRTSSFTQGLDEVEKAYGSDGDVGAALERGGLLLKDMVADGLGSTGLPIAAGLAAIPFAVAGAPALLTGTVAIGLPLLVGSLISTAPIYEEAKKLGADEDAATAAGMIGGGISGVLDRLGAGVILTSLIKQFGKKAIVEELSTEFGTSAAKTIVENAGRVTADIAKGGGKGFVTEGVTEGVQEFVQMAAAGIAADKGIMPYEAEIATKRLIDATALGAVTGKTLGAGSGFVSGRMKQSLAEKELEERNKIAKLDEAIQNEETDIAKVEGFVGNLKQGKRMDSSRLFSGVLKSSISPLRGLFETGGERGATLVNDLNSYFDNLSTAVGTDATSSFQDPETGETINGIIELFEPLKRSVKLPFQKAITAEKMKRLSDVLQNKVDSDPDPDIMRAARNLRNYLGTIETDPTTGKPLQTVKVERSMLQELIDNPDMTQEQSQTLGKINPNTGRFYVNSQIFSLLKDRARDVRQEIDQRVAQSPNEEAAIKREVLRKIKPLEGQVIFKPQSTGKYKELVDAGVDIPYVAGYLPVMFKTGPLARKKLMRILQEEGMTRQGAASVAENIESNEGMYNPNDIKLNIDQYRSPDSRASAATQSFEQARQLPERVRNRLYDEGLIETNVESILYRYMLDANKKIQSEKLKRSIQENVPELAKEDNITQSEVDRIVDIFDAIQGKYKPLKDKRMQAIQKWALTGGYIYTLPLVGLTALSEPLIILSRINPKYALFGGLNAAYNGLASGLRTVFPKLPRTESEKVFRGILQGLDGTLAERFGDLAGVTVSRKVGNAFFRATLLTTLTQISRDMAFQAARLQMRNDLQTIRRYTDAGIPKTKEFVDARKRLTAQGIVNPMTEVVQGWADGLYEGQGDPELIRKVMSKTVDEFIMSPNAVNRPLWMSNPHLATVAQLKGFTAAFGNIVGGRFYRDVLVPLFKGRMPDADIVRYGVALASIMAVSMFAQGLRDQIRYGDDSDESPFSKLDGKEKLTESILRTGILGTSTMGIEALNAEKYGSNFLEAIAGPVISQGTSILQSTYGYLINDKPRELAKEIANLVPILRNIPLVRDTKKDFVDSTEELLEDLRDKVVD
ncbi:MAG: hypothetical protein ACXACY_21130 [Candidatus Hodarchaeales archaeon]